MRPWRMIICKFSQPLVAFSSTQIVSFLPESCACVLRLKEVEVEVEEKERFKILMQMVSEH